MYLEDIKKSIDDKWVCKFAYKNGLYSIYKVKGGFNIVNESSKKFIKLKKYKTLSDTLASINFEGDE